LLRQRTTCGRLTCQPARCSFAYGRFSGINPEAMVTANVVKVQDGRLAEHWDVWEKEATKDESLSGLPMFGDEFPDERRK
jgi:hypothetical protein